MVLEQPWAQKRIFWAFEKSIFQFYANFWVTKLKPFSFSGKVRQSDQKKMFWAFEKNIFQYFENVWVTKLKPFSAKVRQSLQNYLNQNLGVGSFLENGFEATLISKANVLSVWKNHISAFCKFLSEEVETAFWKRRQNVRHYLNQNLVIGSFLENGFEAT